MIVDLYKLQRHRPLVEFSSAGGGRKTKSRLAVGYCLGVPDAVVNEESVGFLTGDDLPELLQGPLCGGMSGDVEVSDPASAHFHDHEDVQHPKSGRHGDEEIASQNALGMVADKGHPTLRRRAATGSCVIGHIAFDGPR